MYQPAARFHAATYGDIVNYITNARVKLFFRVALSRWDIVPILGPEKVAISVEASRDSVEVTALTFGESRSS